MDTTTDTSPGMRKPRFGICFFLGHSYVIPQYPRQFDPIYCRRCGYEPVPR